MVETIVLFINGQIRKVEALVSKESKVCRSGVNQSNGGTSIYYVV